MRDALGVPLSGLMVRLWPEETLALGSGEPRPTAGDGIVVFTDLRPGRYRVTSSMGSVDEVRLAAGGAKSVELSVPAGPRLEGVVVNEQGTPVRDAEIWISTEAPVTSVGRSVVATLVDYDPVAFTDEDGRFVLPSAAGARLIGATAPGYAPSRPTELSSDPHPPAGPIELRLSLPGLGGEVAGVVLDPEGQALPGARVFIDMASDVETLPEGVIAEYLAPMFSPCTDAAGSFRLRGVRPGARRAYVRAPGHAPWRGRFDVSVGEAAKVVVRLERGQPLAGTVVDQDGLPVGGALVFGTRRRWRALPDLRFATVARTSDDGSYELSGLPSGSVWLTVEAGERGRHLELFELEQGGSARLDVQLSRGLELRGRVEGPEGAVLLGCLVTASMEGDWTARSTETDSTGSFCFPDCLESNYDLRITKGGFELLRRSLVPSGEEERLAIPPTAWPSARIAYALRGPDGAPLLAAGLELREPTTLGVWQVGFEDMGNGRYQSALIPPGEYIPHITASTGAAREFDRVIALAEGETFDLGILTVQPSSLVELHFAGPRLLGFECRLTDSDGKLVREWSFQDAALHAAPTIWVPAGDYTLQARASGMIPILETLRVSGLDESPRSFTLRPGVERTLRFNAPSDLHKVHPAILDIHGADGALLFTSELHLGHGRPRSQLEASLSLAPGDYTFEVRTGGGLHASGAFSVVSGPDPEPPLEYRLAPTSSVQPPLPAHERTRE